MRIFIVDDSEVIVKKLKELLAGIEGVAFVGEASTARDAIKSIENLKPDVVILDIRLIGGNGMDVLKHIKKKDPSPIVMMLTNYPYPQYREQCTKLGAEYFFDKVADIENIFDTFRKLAQDASRQKAGPCQGG